MPNPPDSPPAAPVIPEGLATKLGKYGTLLLALVAAAQPFLDGAHDNDAKFYATAATVLASVTIIGRMLQSAAAFRDAPSPKQEVAEAAVGVEYDPMLDDPEAVAKPHENLGDE